MTSSGRERPPWAGLAAGTELARLLRQWLEGGRRHICDDACNDVCADAAVPVAADNDDDVPVTLAEGAACRGLR